VHLDTIQVLLPTYAQNNCFLLKLLCASVGNKTLIQVAGLESFQEGHSDTRGRKYRDVLPGIKLTSYLLVTHRQVLLLLHILYVECWCEPT
jgi:hypothetical protein